MRMPAPAAGSGIDFKAEDEAISAGWNFPVDWYTSSSIFQLERDAIFAKSWQYLAPLSKLARAGDIAVGQLANVSVILIRDEELKLRGFVNACRHRGYPVVRND